MPIKAVIFDFVGTLVNCGGYSMDASRNKLYEALAAEGLQVNPEDFKEAYISAHEKYRRVRYEQLQEVTNAVWLAEALSNLGFNLTAQDSRIKSALNVFFQDFIDSLELRKGAKKIIKQANEKFKIGLISNFTYAPVIYKSMRKLGINEFFNAVVVSHEVGWRKPNPKIFQDALSRLDIQAHDAIYVGDSPTEDIKGAKDAGLKTVFIPSQFNTIEDLKRSRQKPDFVLQNLNELSETLGNC